MASALLLLEDKKDKKHYAMQYVAELKDNSNNLNNS